MKICLLYIVVSQGKKTLDFASRFVATYHDHPPGVEHDTIICCNGGPPSQEIAALFSGVNVKFWPRVNDPSWDLGAYFEAAKTLAAGYDMLLCFGESVHFWKEGWLRRLEQAWNKYGEMMASPFATHVIRAHLQTTAFIISPKLLLQYPLLITNRKSRFEFEHGERALWRLLHAKGYPVRLVTWDGDWGPGYWRVPKNVLWSGDQSNLLFHCNHSQRFAEADEKRKISWKQSADRPFR